jgi:short-subunit dehydrogenase
MGRDRRALENVAERVIVADLAEPSAAARIAADVGDVDVLVNNAGIGWAGRFADMPSDASERLLAVDLLAPILLTRALLPGMLERRHGHVVNVASIVAHTGAKEEAVYAAAKAGLVAFSESLRQELAGTPVRVSVVTPGAIDTPFFARRGSPYGRRWPRPLPPERVADAVVRAIATGRAEVFVPGWMSLPARVRGAFPEIFRPLVDRFHR